VTYLYSFTLLEGKQDSRLRELINAIIQKYFIQKDRHLWTLIDKIIIIQPLI